MIEARSEAKYEINFDDSFKYFLGMSVIVHLSVLLFFSVKMAFFPSDDLIIKSAVRVDMVALPDKVAPPKAKAQPKPKPPVKAPRKKKSAAKLKNQQSDAISRLKAMQAIENIKKEAAEEEAAKPVPKKEFKGNIISKGSALKGLDKFQYDEYFAKLEEHVKNNWILPQWLMDKSLKAQLRVKIDERGYVIGKEIITSSGNVIFDNKAKAAIDKSSPCPVAPDRLKELFASQGVIFNFP